MKHIRRRCNNISYDHIMIFSLTSLPFQQQYKALLNRRTNNIPMGYLNPHSYLYLNCHHFNLYTFQTNEINADFLNGETPLEFVKYWRSFRTPIWFYIILSMIVRFVRTELHDKMIYWIRGNLTRIIRTESEI